MKKNLLFKVRLFSCFFVDFILRRFLFTHIEIVIMPTKKYFLHRDLSFLLYVIKLYSRCKKWANELHKISSAILPLVRTLCFDHFTVENQIDARI